MLGFLSEITELLKFSNILIIYCLFYVLSSSIIYLWRNDSNFSLKNNVYIATQKVHVGNIPRLGGVVTYICLWGFIIVETDLVLLQTSLICILPMMFITFKEDLFYNVSYQIRLFGLTLSSFCLIFFTVTNFPEINFLPMISNVFDYKIFNIIFFTICIVVLANGSNFIDGMNGLCSFFFLGAMFSCIYLSYIQGDTENGKLMFVYALTLIPFITLNFPFGKMFLGDAGAFLYAMLIGIWVVNFFGMHSTISSWNAILIFFYPTTEVLYSFIRKIYQKKSPFYPDRKHLHLLIYDYFNKTFNAKKSNNLTTMSLIIFWLTPTLLIPLVYQNQILIIASYFFLFIIYMSIAKRLQKL